MLQNTGDKLEYFRRYKLFIHVFSTIKDNLFKDKRENIIIYKYAVYFCTNIEP